MYHVFICSIWNFTVHVLFVCYVQLPHVQWVRLGPGSIDLDDSWCCDFGGRTIYFLIEDLFGSPPNSKSMPPLARKTGLDKGSLADDEIIWVSTCWIPLKLDQPWNFLRFRPSPRYPVTTMRWECGSGENPERTIFLVERILSVGGVAFIFLQKLPWEKKVRFFCKNNLVQVVMEIICKTSVQVKASSGGIYKCIHGPRVTWSKGLSVGYGAGAKWDLKVDEMWHTRTTMEKLWKQVRKRYTVYKYIYNSI